MRLEMVNYLKCNDISNLDTLTYKEFTEYTHAYMSKHMLTLQIKKTSCMQIVEQ